MSKKADPEQVTLPIPVETYRNFFALDALKPNNQLRVETYHATPFILASLVANGSGIPDNIVQEIRDAETTEGATSFIVSEMEGGFFIALQYKSGSLATHIIASGLLKTIPVDERNSEQEEYSLEPVALLIGTEDRENRSPATIVPHIIRCLMIDDATQEKWQNFPATISEFYASLNYIRFALLSCANQDPIDIEINQLELVDSKVTTAEDEFVKNLGNQTVQSILSDYRLTRSAYQTLLGLHKLEYEQQPALTSAPTRHFH